MRIWVFLAFVACSPFAAPIAAAQTWWYLGETSEGSGLYIDADSLNEVDEGIISYTGMFVYNATWTSDGGDVIRYETFDAELDCLYDELFEYRRAFYRDDRTKAFAQDTRDSIVVEEGKASGTEADFVCAVESQWPEQGFSAVGDPVSHKRGW